MLLFLITNMAAVTSHANNQILQFGFLTCQEGNKALPFLCVTKTFHSKASAYVSQGRQDLATGITCLDQVKKKLRIPASI